MSAIELYCEQNFVKLTDEEKQKIEQNLTDSLHNIYNMKDEKLDEADYNKISF